MINLLPEEIKQRHHVNSVIYSTILAYIVVLAALGLGAAVMATYNFSNQASINEKEARLSDLKSARAKNGEIINQAAFIEDRLKAEPTYKDKSSWNSYLTKVAASTPVDVQLTNITINNDTGLKLSIDGHAATLRSAILMRDRLSSDKVCTSPTFGKLNQSGDANSQKYDFGLSCTITGS